MYDDSRKGRLPLMVDPAAINSNTVVSQDDWVPWKCLKFKLPKMPKVEDFQSYLILAHFKLYSL